MPTYEYACRSCGEHLEIVQSFRDDALTTCPNCEGQLRKVFSAAGIIFKGSGWHSKDYADKRGGAPARADSDKDSAADSSGDSPSESADSASSGDKASGDKPSGDKASGDKPSGDKASGDKSSSTTSGGSSAESA